MTVRVGRTVLALSGPAMYLLLAAAAVVLLLLTSCAHTGRLQDVGHRVAPPMVDSTATAEGDREERREVHIPLSSMFGDTLVGLMPGTADSSKRCLGRLRDGYTVDTLNFIVCGDNRPGYRLKRLEPQLIRIRQGLSFNPFRIVRGLVNIPWAIARGLYPDLALFREVPALVTHMPKWGREHAVLSAMMAKIDSVHARGQIVAAVINTGDLVQDGQNPGQWKRFLRITQPLTSRTPYFPIAGNHERTDTVLGVENWRTATGLPIGGDRLYYCFDSADGWVRFIALDSNPIVDPGNHWTREVQVAYSDEEFTWAVKRIKEHTGPVLVFMHHPPFSASEHRMEWQRDSVLVERRERMLRALHDAGIAIIASGHEHSYQRALFTWPDAVLITIASGGAGAPLTELPATTDAVKLFTEYKVAGAIVKPENVFTSQVFNFTHMRLWFGGGDFYTYAVDENAGMTMIDHVQIDLTRYGIPNIDQHKVPIAKATGPTAALKPAVSTAPAVISTKVDSTSASERLLAKPPPGGKLKKRVVSPARRDTVRVLPRPASTTAPIKPK